MNLFKPRKSLIFKDASWLQPLSNPPGGKPLCRDADLRVMATFLSEIFRAGQARNLFIHGKPGTGKTVCIRHLLNEVNRHATETNTKVTTAYVNAGRTRTPYYTMLEIIKELGLNVPDAGWQMFRLKQAFERLLNEKSVVLALDEVDSIIFKEKEPLVYYLNRQPKTTLILISNKVEDATQLPQRALSTLQPQLFKLEPYTLEEAKKILADRVKHAFQPNVLSDELLSIVAETASHTGDIRLGFSILLSAGLVAEVAGKSTIDAEDIQSAVESETRLEMLRKIEEIDKQLDGLERRRKSRFKAF